MTMPVRMSRWEPPLGMPDGHHLWQAGSTWLILLRNDLHGIAVSCSDVAWHCNIPRPSVSS